ncbi:type VI secretion system tip protein VgrG [Duganella callida]|uniref:Type VI secretion system tip protein VgrG n=2 Tax=Duganella callida TaxID=2561932 RepID=A0A4Y9RYM0_9BURK|nr:type VI secretion system tip protein VgrG [Duganella callida]
MTAARELVTSNRPLRLRLELPGGFNDDLLLPQRVYGTEHICGGIEYRVLCVSGEVQLPLKQMIAVPARLEIVTDRGALRSVCGIVTEASSGDSDGGLASYQLVLRDALAILEKRTNTRVFRNMDEVEIVQRILNEWRHKNSVLGVCFKHELCEAFELRTYPKREFTMQHNESDAHFIRRLLKRRGIGWYVRANGDSHTLVLFNRSDTLRQNAAGTVRYHRDSATEQRDTITRWSAVRSLQPGVVTRHSWDYRNPEGRDFMLAQADGSNNQGPNGNEMAASLDDYQILPPHAGNDNEDLFRMGQLRLRRHDYESKCFHGEGSVRDLCAGEYFRLAEHPEVDQHPAEERDFVVTALRVAAQNNLPKALAARVEGLFTRSRWAQDGDDMQMQRELGDKVADGPLRMHIQLTAVRRTVPIVPAFDPRTDVPQAQMQSAVVVGPEGEEVYCDELGRVKIRFPGTRPEDHAEVGGATDTEADSAWVRVASNWAGAGPSSLVQCGTLGLPRIGTEVLVSFLGGDPDKPVIVAQLYNQSASPPSLRELAGLPDEKYLAGFKSKEVRGSRSNQVRFDDTPGEINAQLASDHGHTELNLGFLTHPNANGKSEPRGEGAELRSDKAVSIRGGEGVLISASGRTRAAGALLSRDELSTLAEASQHVAEELTAVAARHSIETENTRDLSDLVNRVKNWDGEGENTSIGESQPIIAMSAPAGAFIGSQMAVAIAAKASAHVLSLDNAYIETGRNLMLRAMQGVSVFALKLGIKLIAASGNIKIEAHNGDIEITSLKKIRLTATEGIEIQSQAVKIVAQGCQVDYGAGAITQQSKGDHTIKSSKFKHENGSDGRPVNLSLPSTEVDHDQQVLVTDMITDEPIIGRRYRVTLEDGKVVEGKTDNNGLTERFASKIAFARFEIELLE